MNRLLASDTVGAPVLILFLSPLIVAVIGLVFLAAKRSRAADPSARAPAAAAPRSPWGLIAGLVAALFGALLLLFLLTVRGGAPHFFYIVALFPLIVGIKILQLWSRPRPR